MLRLIIIFLVFLLVSFCWKIIYYILNTVVKHITNANNINTKCDNPETTHDLTKCTICGLYIPSSDAIFYRNEVFCCPAHAKQKK